MMNIEALGKVKAEKYKEIRVFEKLGIPKYRDVDDFLDEHVDKYALRAMEKKF